MKKYLYPLVAVVVYTVTQTIAAMAMVIPVLIVTVKNQGKDFDPQGVLGNTMFSGGTLALALTIGAVLSVAAFAAMKMIKWNTVVNVRNMSWTKAAAFVVAAIIGMFACNLAEEMLDLPNLLEEELPEIAKTTIGMLSIAVFGPICEEFAFREVALGCMLRHGSKPWVAIALSALAFGLVHGNPAQIPFAAAMGVMLGYVYYKTDSIVIPSIIHIINNSVAVIMMNTMGDSAKDFSMVEQIGGTPVAIILAVIGVIVCATIMHMVGKNIRKA